MHPVAQSLNTIRAELEQKYLERTDTIYSMLLAILAGEHHFTLGPPGTGKSQMIRDLVAALSGASYFEVAMSKTRPAEAVMGPLNIKEFRENGNYFLKRAGFASAVDIAFFDEIGKMSPVLGHDMLALLNERVYHEVNGGRSVHDAPLHIAFTASNEMPMNESDDAAALWDRLLIRTHVDYIADRKAWATMLTADRVVTPISPVDFDDVRKASLDLSTIAIDRSAIESLMDLRLDLEGKNVRPSDRRWRASMKVLQAAAFLDGRTSVNEADLAALRFTLWDALEQVETVEMACLAVSNPFIEEITEALRLLEELDSGITARANEDNDVRLAYAKEVNVKLKDARKILDTVLTKADADDRKVPNFVAAHERHISVMTRLFEVMFEHDHATARQAAEGRVGLGVGKQAD